jgi:hypothetical protein
MSDRTGEREEGALAGAVRADQRPALAAANPPVDAAQDLGALWGPDADALERQREGIARFVLGEPWACHAGRRTTGFVSEPSRSIVMVTSSPSSSVNSDGGTMPVPVIRKTPAGKVLARRR